MKGKFLKMESREEGELEGGREKRGEGEGKRIRKREKQTRIKNDKNTKTKQLIYETWSTETENGRKGQVGGAKEGKKVEL